MSFLISRAVGQVFDDRAHWLAPVSIWIVPVMQGGLMSSPSLVAMACHRARRSSASQIEASTLFGKAFTNWAMRTPGSPKLPSVGFIVASGLTSAPPGRAAGVLDRGPQLAGLGVLAPAAGSQSTVYGVGGAVMAATRIRLSGSALSALMSLTNCETGVRAR